MTAVTLRRPDLRWPIPPEIRERLTGQRIEAVRRRAKYLLLDSTDGSALLHLGMSGSLRVLPADTSAGAHDHVDFLLDAAGNQPGQVLRFNDPRRFGCLLWQPPGEIHALLRELGPEPLSDGVDGAAFTGAAFTEAAFTENHLYARSRGRSAPVKSSCKTMPRL